MAAAVLLCLPRMRHRRRPVPAQENPSKPLNHPGRQYLGECCWEPDLGPPPQHVGVAAGAEIERLTSPAPATGSVALVPGGSGAWIAVAAVESIPLGQVKRFETDFVIGFIRHTSAGFSALSGTCTHMGCLLLWNAKTTPLIVPVMVDDLPSRAIPLRTRHYL